jgi:hypothetical protein
MKLIEVFHAVTATGLCLCGPALADNCSGHYSQVVTQAQSFDLGNGHKLDMFMTKTTADSTNSPFTGTGQCTGYALTTADGKTRAAGICGRKNKDGSWSDAWAIEPGADRGTWKLVDTSGAYAGKSASGWWQDVASEGGVTVGKWGGNCN